MIEIYFALGIGFYVGLTSQDPKGFARADLASLLRGVILRFLLWPIGLIYQIYLAIKRLESIDPASEELQEDDLYPRVIWVKEPHNVDFFTDEVFREKREIANCYARRGSHWIKYYIDPEELEVE